MKYKRIIPIIILVLVMVILGVGLYLSIDDQIKRYNERTAKEWESKLPDYSNLNVTNIPYPQVYNITISGNTSLNVLTDSRNFTITGQGELK